MSSHHACHRQNVRCQQLSRRGQYFEKLDCQGLLLSIKGVHMILSIHTELLYYILEMPDPAEQVYLRRCLPLTGLEDPLHVLQVR